MPKKRSKSQKIGDIGEDTFRLFARKNGLLPNKVESDYGIDFLCQCVEEHDDGLDIVTPVFVFANVKASGKTRTRRKLERDDIENSPQCVNPLFFILVDTLNDKLYYKFFDLDLLEEFHNAIINNSEYTLTPSTMTLGKENDIDFQNELTRISKPEYQDKLKIRKYELQLENIFGNAELKIIQHNDGNLAIIKTSKIENIYKRDSQSFSLARDTFLSCSFDNETWLPQTTLDTQLLESFEPIASKILMVSPMPHFSAQITVTNKLKKAKSTFEVRKFHDETSYYHPSGLTLISSKARKNETDGLYYHHFEVVCKDTNAEPLFNHPEVIKFIKLCKADSKIYFSKKIKNGIPLTHWSELIRLQKVVSGIELIYRKLKIKNPVIKLPDTYTPKYAYSLSILERFFRHNNRTKEILPGFVLAPEGVEIIWKKTELFCPLIVTLPEGTMVLNLEFLGRVAFEAEEKTNTPAGVRFTKLESCEIKSYEKIEIEYPIMPLNGTMAMEFTEKAPQFIEYPCEEKISFILK